MVGFPPGRIEGGYLSYASAEIEQYNEVREAYPYRMHFILNPLIADGYHFDGIF